MILAVDALYTESPNGPKGTRGLVAGVVFEKWDSVAMHKEYTLRVSHVAPYEPGQFYRRELPCIIALLDTVQEPIDTIIVDGYVDTTPEHAGLGRHLYNHLCSRVVVVGVAKTHFDKSEAVKVSRFGKRPLYITSAGIEIEDAAQLVRNMGGPYRIPDMLRRVDALTRMK